MLGGDAMCTPIPASSCTAFQYLSRCANPDSTRAPASPLVRGLDLTTHPNCTTGTRKPRRREGDKCVFAQFFSWEKSFVGEARGDRPSGHVHRQAEQTHGGRGAIDSLRE